MGFSQATLGNIALFSQGAGVGVSTLGAYGSARFQRESVLSQADLASTNARIAELGAQTALLQGQRASGQLAFQQGQRRGAQRAAQAANGVDLSVGSAAEVRASSEVMSQIDRNTLEANAISQAWGYRTEAVNYQNAARTGRATAKAINPYLNAGTSLLGGAGQVASTWYQIGNR